VTPSRRGLLLGTGAALVATPIFVDPVVAPAQDTAPHATEDDLVLTGALRQGGFAMGLTRPNAEVAIDGTHVGRASSRGLFVVGFDRDAPSQANLKVDWTRGRLRDGGVVFDNVSRTLDIAPGTFPSSRIDGLPPSTVEPSDPELLARIQRELAAKTAAFASCADTEDFAGGFVWPLESYRVSSLWGAQRILNGTPARPHYGIDLAAPEGTPIHAPAPGLVVFAEPDMHFEGGLVLIDHGQGLITAYLHQSRIDVTPGRRLARGDTIGRVGMKGRATGPHLCWRMKWRDRNLDPSLMIGAMAPGIV
jgi:murein DD-endopeptidase MepM/ murein hydrolase activator NlpD